MLGKREIFSLSALGQAVVQADLGIWPLIIEGLLKKSKGNLAAIPDPHWVPTESKGLATLVKSPFLRPNIVR